MDGNKFILIFLLLLFSLIDFGGCNSTDNKSTLPNKSTSVNNYDAALYSKYDNLLIQLARKNQVDWLFCKAIVIKESHFDDKFISTCGAVGLMQLMPQKHSYITTNYNNFIQARKQKYNSEGKRFYNNKSVEKWAGLYHNDLKVLLEIYKNQPNKLYKRDSRFKPDWNLTAGIEQLAADFHFFLNRKHSKYESLVLTSSAYNAGRGAVVKKNDPMFDHIPINRQTELYSVGVELIYEALQRGNGKILDNDLWILSL